MYSIKKDLASSSPYTNRGLNLSGRGGRGTGNKEAIKFYLELELSQVLKSTQKLSIKISQIEHAYW